MSARTWASRTKTGIAWSVASFASGRALTFLATLVLARLLSPADFGVVAAILAFLALLELGSDLGMKATIVYEQENRRTSRLDTAFTINFLIAGCFCGAGVLLAPAIAGFFEVPDQAWLFRLAMLSLPLTAMGNVQDAILLRDLELGRRIVPELIRGFVRGGLAIGLALGGAGAEALVWGLLAGQAAWAASLWLVTGYRPTPAFDFAIARSMASYGSAAVALAVLSVVGTRAPVIVVGKVLGPAALGLWTIGARVPELLVGGVSWSFSVVAFPALSKMRELSRGDLARSAALLLRYQALAAIPAGALLAVLATPVVVVAFSAKWVDAGPVMSAVAVAAAIEALGYPLGDLLKSLARQPLLLAINLTNVPVLIAVIVFVAPYGLAWVAWAVAAQSLVHFAMFATAAWRVADLKPRAVLHAIAPALVATAGAASAAGAVRIGFPAAAAGPLAAGLVAGVAGGAGAVRILLPEAFREVRDQLLGSRRDRRGREAMPGVAPGATGLAR